MKGSLYNQIGRKRGLPKRYLSIQIKMCSQWKICTCDKERAEICRRINLNDPAHAGPCWADIGMHPHWLVCGHAGEKIGLD